MNLKALEPLLKLIVSEDKVVKRNATMCLGTMAQNGMLFCTVRDSQECYSIIKGAISATPLFLFTHLGK